MTPAQPKLFKGNRQQVVQGRPGWVVLGNLDKRRILVDVYDGPGRPRRPDADRLAQSDDVGSSIACLTVAIASEL